MGKAQVTLEFDLSSFNSFTKQVPGVMDNITKDSFRRGAGKMRKGFIDVIDNKNFKKLEKTAKYRSKYSKAMKVMKPLIRYKATGGHKKVTATIGVFVGKAGRKKISNDAFKTKYGVTLAKFAQVLTHGGKLKVAKMGGIKRLIKEGFYVKKGIKFLKFPKRDWFTPNKWRREHVIIPYIERVLNNLVEKKINGELNAKTKRFKKKWRK